MKQKFTFLMVALMLLIMIFQPGMVWGQAKTNFVINTTNFTKPNSGSGYAAYNGDRDIDGITITSSNVMIQISKLQFKTNSGYLYNKTAIPGVITKITLASATNFTIYVGDLQNPSSTTVTSGSTISGNYSYFKIKGGADTPKTATITVEYTPTHKLMYSYDNEQGSIRGVYYNTSTAVTSGTAITEGAKVSLTAEAEEGYRFVSWECTTTGSPTFTTDGNTATFTMGTADATVTAIFESDSTDPTITVSETSLTGFNYVAGNGPSASQSFTVSGANLTENISLATTNGKYEFSTDDSNFANTLTLDKNGSGVVALTTVYVRMKSDLSVGDNDDVISITSGEISQSISLDGYVTPTHTITYNANNGSITGVGAGSTTVASGDYIAEEATVELTAEANPGYKFTGWSVSGTGSGLSSTSDNPTTFTMGTENSTVTATFVQAYAITISNSIEHGSVSSSTSLEASGETVTITATPSSGYELRAFVVTKGGDFVTTTSIGTNTATFTMPAEAVNVSALFKLSSATTWQSTSLASLTGDDVFVIVSTKNSSSYAMTNNNGTGSAPTASSVTVSNGNITSTVNDNMKWNISGNANDGYVFYPNGSTTTWLYCRDDNNGLRVGGTGDAKTFEIKENYIYNKGQTRYIGVYNSSDWRSYTSINNNISGQTFSFYKEQEPQPEVAATTASLSDFTYVAGSGPSTRQVFSVCGDNLTHDVTISLENTNFEISTDGSTYQSTTITLSKGSGTTVALTPIYVRLKTGLGSGNYECTITIASDGAEESVSVALTGNVKQTITIDNGITHGTVTAAPSPAIAGETVTLTIESEENYSLKTLRVYKASEPTEVTVTNNQFVMPTDAVTVTATFVTSRTITYKANGGSGDDVVREFAEGNDATIADYDLFTREGKVIQKWNTQSDGNGDDYIAGAKISDISKDYEMYAIWRDIRYHITFDVNGNTTAIIPINVDYGNNTGALPATTMTGYTHIGWSLTPSGALVSDPYEPTGLVENITLYAVFEMTYENEIALTKEGLPTSYPSEEENWNSSISNINRYDIIDGQTSGNHYIQFRNASGYLYNESSLGTITSIIVRYYSQNNHNLKVRQGDSKITSSSGGTEVTGSDLIGETNAVKYIFSSDKDFFYIYNVTSMVQVNSIVINYETSAQILTINGEETINDDIESTDHIVVTNGAILTFNGNNNGNANNLIIEDGGQLILANGNTGVQATVKKSTDVYSAPTKAIKWYAISSPVDYVLVTSFVKGEKHNVYSYITQSCYWNEYRGVTDPTLGTAPFANLTNGRGYIYRSQEEGIEFKGDVNVGNITCQDLGYTCSNTKYNGFNLIGNPFTHEITWSNLTTADNIKTDGFYTLTTEGEWATQTIKDGKIAPMQAFMVQANTASPAIVISNIVGGGGGKGDDDRFGGDQIMFNVENSEYSDVAYVLFKEGHGLNKIEHRNDRIPMIYIIDNDENFAIADMPDNTSVINLGFEAMTMGKYTISLKVKGQYSYMHLFDKLTGDDVDMLVEDSYTFIGSQSDRKDRFVLRLNYNAANIDNESDIFAYQSGSDIIISGEGELQIFDITGRKVMTTAINGVETINGLNNGVYIFKLEGKTQKIVVR